MKRRFKKGQIPGPRGKLLFGSLTEFRAGMLPFFERCREQYGTVVAFRLGRRRLVLISEPSLIEEVLVTQNKVFRKHFATRLLKPVLGRGLLLSEGKQWLRQRRLVQPSFSRRFTRELAEIVQRHTSCLANEWRQNPRRDIYHDMTKLTVQIAAQAFLGVSDSGDTEEIGDCLEVIHADFEHRFQHPWNLPVWSPSRRNRELRLAIKRLTFIIDRMIELRRHDAEERHDALSLLLRAEDGRGHRIPMQLLRDEVMTLLLAGHDTTANALTWTWSLLAQHPAVMSLLKEEATHTSQIQFETDEFPYTQRVIKESMRLFPPVYLFGREATRSIQLGDYTLRKGDSVVISQWVLHRDKRFYSEPTDFEPERWTPDFERSLPKHAYIPFGGGPRVCIGKDVAMVEASAVLATLAAEFNVSLESPEELCPWPTVTLRPQGAVWAQVVRHRSSQEVQAGDGEQNGLTLSDKACRPPSFVGSKEAN